MKKNVLISLTALVLLLQCLAIGWLIFRYERVVVRGTEVRLRCQAFDPYDPLRGRYLQMRVAETCTEGAQGYDKNYYWVYPLYVRLEQNGDGSGLYHVAEVAQNPTGDGLWIKPKQTTVTIRPALEWNDRKEGESDEDFNKRKSEKGFIASVEFPHQFFLNEKLAPEAERLLQGSLSDAVAVYRIHDGNIVLTDVEIGGTPVCELTRQKLEEREKSLQSQQP